MNRPRVGILTIGSELTSGTRVDTNSGWLARRLPALGLEPWLVRSAPDRLEAITRAFRETAAECDLLVSTGGLGPTSDDLTRDALASLLGVPLELDAACLARIEAKFRAFGRDMSPSNRRQAEFPRGARVLQNDKGTADGFALDVLGKRTWVLPGVPREMRWLWETWLVPDLRGRGAGARLERVFRVVGLPESLLGERLDPIEKEPGVEVRYCVEEAHGTIEVRVLVDGDDARADALAARAQELAGPRHVGATGERSLAEAVARLLMEKRLTVTTAESCTGGRVAAALTSVPGVSASFMQGFVTYSNEAKSKLLGVDPKVIEQHGAVSEPCARAMAAGARAAADTDLAVAITGIAGPDGGTPAKPVGLVHFAVARRDGTVTHLERKIPGDREQVQVRSTAAALDLLRLAALG